MFRYFPRAVCCLAMPDLACREPST
jgi:hypothetical protein